MADPMPVIDDLCAESDELDSLVAELSPEQWKLVTPAPGWTVAHQIAHLAWTDHAALLAVTDQGAFSREVEKALAAPGDFVDNGAEEGAGKPPRGCSRTGARDVRTWPTPCGPPPKAPASPGTARPCPPPPWPPPASWRPGPTAWTWRTHWA